tara:strand:+ start:289 stop:642 length:354 start_codon:yes stop_codon:yes gene_type:complete
MKKFFISISILFIFFFSPFSQVKAAEVLQVSSSSILLIGDHNRTYTVKIACLDISSEMEAKSIKWLKEKLPRHTKVNLRPKGSIDGMLVAKVIPFNSNIDIAEEYIEEGLAADKCSA